MTTLSDLPRATSTPRSAQPVVETGARQNGDHRDSNEDEAKRFSTSSEFTQVSTTDISSHGDDLDNELIDQVTLNKNLQRHVSDQSQRSIAALSDVVLEDTTSAVATLSFLPPPIPTSPPPDLETEGSVDRVGFIKHDLLYVGITASKWMPSQPEEVALRATNIMSQK